MFKKSKDEAPTSGDFKKLKTEFDDGSFSKDLMGEGKRCCLIIDLELGMWFLGGVQCINAISGIFAIIFNACFFLYNKGIPMDYLIYLTVLTIFMIPSWFGAIYYGRFFMKGNKKGLPKAHLLNIVTIVLVCAWSIIGGEIFFGISLPYPAAGAAPGQHGAHHKDWRIMTYNIIGALLFCLCQAHWFRCAQQFQ